VFEVRGSRYAVEASAVREIVRLPELTAIEELPSYVVGVIDLRGKIVPVLDLNLRLGHAAQPYRLDDSVVVLESEEGPVGLLVNRVHAVRDLAASDIDPVPTAGPDVDPATRFIASLARSADEIVMLLHRENLLRLPELPEEASPGKGAVAFDAPPEERRLFRERARELAQPLAGEDTTGRVPLAVVRLRGELFGIDLQVVREFAELRGVTPAPCCPPHILGLLNLRGDLYTLVDLGALLELPAAGAAPAGQIVVLDLPDLGIGVPVDEVLDVRYFQPGELAPVPAAARPTHAAFIQGTAPYRGRMLSILNLPRLFAQERWIVNEEP
jgi:purine-binding chemotaxis protein CheW